MDETTVTGLAWGRSVAQHVIIAPSMTVQTLVRTDRLLIPIDQYGVEINEAFEGWFVLPKRVPLSHSQRRSPK
jgi:hypothetical protein